MQASRRLPQALLHPRTRHTSCAALLVSHSCSVRLIRACHSGDRAVIAHQWCQQAPAPARRQPRALGGVQQLRAHVRGQLGGARRHRHSTIDVLIDVLLYASVSAGFAVPGAHI